MNIVNASFLESKIAYRNIPFHGDVPYKASSGNITRIADNIFRFTEYNFLPGVDGDLDGHYTFYVNIHTFDYLIYKSACYGGFTYVLPSNNISWVVNLIPREKQQIESVIAHKLLYSRHHNHEFEFKSDTFRYRGGSLITDLYDFETLSDIDNEAIKILK